MCTCSHINDVMLQRPLNRLVHPCDPVLQVLHQVRLRAFYAVPKMVVIPSAQALGRRKLPLRVAISFFNVN